MKEKKDLLDLRIASNKDHSKFQLKMRKEFPQYKKSDKGICNYYFL